MTRERVKRCVGDRGAMLIEAAFAFPIFLTLLFGIIDIGYAEFQTSQATAAARDGARVAILSFNNADVTGSTDSQTIVTQINARLAGQQVGTIAVSCLSGLTGSTAETCSTASPDQDRVRVTVSWSYVALTPVMASFGLTTISGTATMAIVGSPTGLPTTTTSPSTTTTTTTAPGSTTTSTSTTTTTTTPPGGCAITNLTVSPALPLQLKNGGPGLESHTTFTVTTNGAAPCTGLKIQFPTAGSSTTKSLTFGGGSTWSTTVNKNDYSWAAGTNLPLLIQNSSGTTLSGGTFAVTVQ